ncbi:hypothetical protein [Streptodolium elevatio]|uniref:Uncharacterized protein n=1 Tax=Streptodolium elevatio TaxID=3157996 RepID=A0ABV3DPJ1_9ACTN
MAILRLVLRRLVSSVPLPFTVSALTFALVSLVRQLTAKDTAPHPPTEEGRPT